MSYPFLYSHHLTVGQSTLSDFNKLNEQDGLLLEYSKVSLPFLSI